MNVQQLYNLLSPCLNKGILMMPAATVDGPNGPICSLITSWIGNTFTINEVSGLTVESDSVVVSSGNMSIFGLQNQSVTSCIFFLSDPNGVPASEGSPALIIYFDLIMDGTTDSWNFSQSFPILADSGFSDYLSSTSISLLLSSNAQSTYHSFIDIKAGLNFFSENLSVPGIFSIIAGLFNGSSQLSVSGPIGILSGNITDPPNLLPAIHILSPESSTELGGFLELGIKFGAVTEMIKNQFTPSFQLISSVKIGSSPEIDIIASLPISDRPGRMIMFEADLEKIEQYGIEQLQQFVNGTDFSAVLNGFFDVGEILVLKNIRVYIDTSQINKSLSLALSAISIDIGTPDNKSWTFIKDANGKAIFTLDRIDISFMINSPGHTPTVSAIMDGKVTLVEDITLDTSISFPTPQASLTLDKPVSLTKIINYFDPSLTGFPELELQSFNISADPDSGQYGMSADITSEWIIDIGIAKIDLTEASFALNYDKASNPVFSGSIYAGAKILPPSGSKTNVPAFSVNWNIPGSFSLEGKFPEIALTLLFDALLSEVNLSLPSSFPVVTLKDADIKLIVQNGQSGNESKGTSYDLTITTEIDFNATKVGLIFELQKDDSGQVGGVAGIWTKDWSWSPADQWPEVFGTVLKGLNFSKAGLIVSSLPYSKLNIATAPSQIPVKIDKGLTFFTTIGFGDSVLSILENFFPGSTEMSFYALIADPLSNSSFTGIIGQSSSTSKYSFNGLSFSVTPAQGKFSIQTGVTFSFKEVAGPNKGNEVTLNFVGGGSVNLEAEFTLYFALKAAGHPNETLNIELANTLIAHAHLNDDPKDTPGWKDPLGIRGLTINNFWGEIEVSAEASLNLGFGGDVLIGDAGPDQVELILALVGGFVAEIPEVEVFMFSIKETSPGKAIQLTTLIKDYTSLDVSWVPILNSIGFKNFSLLLVLDPAGWTNPATQKFYPLGFNASGDITFYGLEAVFDIIIEFDRGIKASGFITEGDDSTNSKPINIGNGLIVLSDETGKKGPYGSIDTFAITQPNPKDPYLLLSGQYNILSFTGELYAYVKSDSFYFEAGGSTFIFKEKIICSLDSKQHFFGSVGGGIGFSAHTPAVTIDGLTIIPAINLSVSLDATFTITANPGFSFEVTGSFAWGSLTLTVEFGLTITSWSDLKDLLITFFETYPKEIFRDIISTVSKWVQAVKYGLIKVGEEAAKILKNVYNQLADAAAQFLSDIGWAAYQIKNALVDVWNKTIEEAEKIVGDIAKFCSITTAWLAISGGALTVAQYKHEVQLRLANSLVGTDLLILYHKHQEQIDTLLDTPDIRNRLVRMREDDTVIRYLSRQSMEEAITLIKELGEKGNAELKADVEPALQIIRPYREMTFTEFNIILKDKEI